MLEITWNLAYAKVYHFCWHIPEAVASLRHIRGGAPSFFARFFR